MSDEAELSAKARHQFRSRLGWLLAAWAGNFFAIFFINGASISLRGHGLSNVEVTPLALWFLGSFAVTSVRFKTRRCPRCGKHWDYINPFARACSACRLRR